MENEDSTRKIGIFRTCNVNFRRIESIVDNWKKKLLKDNKNLQLAQNITKIIAELSDDTRDLILSSTMDEEVIEERRQNFKEALRYFKKIEIGNFNVAIEKYGYLVIDILEKYQQHLLVITKKTSTTLASILKQYQVVIGYEESKIHEPTPEPNKRTIEYAENSNPHGSTLRELLELQKLEEARVGTTFIGGKEELPKKMVSTTNSQLTSQSLGKGWNKNKKLVSQKTVETSNFGTNFESLPETPPITKPASPNDTKKSNAKNTNEKVSTPQKKFAIH